MNKIKCWTVYSNWFPGGIVYENRADALADSAEIRMAGEKAYVRVQHFTREELDALPEE